MKISRVLVLVGLFQGCSRGGNEKISRLFILISLVFLFLRGVTNLSKENKWGGGGDFNGACVGGFLLMMI